MNSQETIEKSLYWQRVVLSASTNPKQRERCKRAIDRLLTELAQAKQ